MSVSGNPVTMYSPPTSQQHIFYLAAGNSAQGFFIEHTYRVRPERAARGITGFSMGGYGALRMAFSHPRR